MLPHERSGHAPHRPASGAQAARQPGRWTRKDKKTKPDRAPKTPAFMSLLERKDEHGNPIDPEIALTMEGLRAELRRRRINKLKIQVHELKDLLLAQAHHLRLYLKTRHDLAVGRKLALLRRYTLSRCLSLKKSHEKAAFETARRLLPHVQAFAEYCRILGTDEDRDDDARELGGKLEKGTDRKTVTAPRHLNEDKEEVLLEEDEMDEQGNKKEGVGVFDVEKISFQPRDVAADRTGMAKCEDPGHLERLKQAYRNVGLNPDSLKHSDIFCPPSLVGAPTRRGKNAVALALVWLYAMLGDIHFVYGVAPHTKNVTLEMHHLLKDLGWWNDPDILGECINLSNFTAAGTANDALEQRGAQCKFVLYSSDNPAHAAAVKNFVEKHHAQLKLVPDANGEMVGQIAVRGHVFARFNDEIQQFAREGEEKKEAQASSAEERAQEARDALEEAEQAGNLSAADRKRLQDEVKRTEQASKRATKSFKKKKLSCQTQLRFLMQPTWAYGVHISATHLPSFQEYQLWGQLLLPNLPPDLDVGQIRSLLPPLTPAGKECYIGIQNFHVSKLDPLKIKAKFETLYAARCELIVKEASKHDGLPGLLVEARKMQAGAAKRIQDFWSDAKEREIEDCPELDVGLIDVSGGNIVKAATGSVVREGLFWTVEQTAKLDEEGNPTGELVPKNPRKTLAFPPRKRNSKNGDLQLLLNAAKALCFFDQQIGEGGDTDRLIVTPSPEPLAEGEKELPAILPIHMSMVQSAIVPSNDNPNSQGTALHFMKHQMAACAQKRQRALFAIWCSNMSVAKLKLVFGDKAIKKCDDFQSWTETGNQVTVLEIGPTGDALGSFGLLPLASPVASINGVKDILQARTGGSLEQASKHLIVAAGYKMFAGGLTFASSTSFDVTVEIEDLEANVGSRDVLMCPTSCSFAATAGAAVDTITQMMGRACMEHDFKPGSTSEHEQVQTCTSKDAMGKCLGNSAAEDALLTELQRVDVGNPEPVYEPDRNNLPLPVAEGAGHVLPAVAEQQQRIHRQMSVDRQSEDADSDAETESAQGADIPEQRAVIVHPNASGIDDPYHITGPPCSHTARDDDSSDDESEEEEYVEYRITLPDAFNKANTAYARQSEFTGAAYAAAATDKARYGAKGFTVKQTMHNAKDDVEMDSTCFNVMTATRRDECIARQGAIDVEHATVCREREAARQAKRVAIQLAPRPDAPPLDPPMGQRKFNCTPATRSLGELEKLLEAAWKNSGHKQYTKNVMNRLTLDEAEAADLEGDKVLLRQLPASQWDENWYGKDGAPDASRPLRQRVDSSAGGFQRVSTAFTGNVAMGNDGLRKVFHEDLLRAAKELNQDLDPNRPRTYDERNGVDVPLEAILCHEPAYAAWEQEQLEPWQESQKRLQKNAKRAETARLKRADQKRKADAAAAGMELRPADADAAKRARAQAKESENAAAEPDLGNYQAAPPLQDELEDSDAEMEPAQEQAAGVGL